MSEQLEPKKSPIIDMFQEQLVKDFVISILPKVTPMLKPLSEKLDKYLGNNEKNILITRPGKSSAKVLVLDNSKNYMIIGGTAYKFTIESKKDDKGETLPPEAILKYFDTEEFLTALLSGKFSE